MNDREGEMMEPTDAEDDLLDMAFGLEATSRYFNEPTSRILSLEIFVRLGAMHANLCHTRVIRLACQIILTKELEGLEMRLPQATRNFYVDGHVPQPH